MLLQYDPTVQNRTLQLTPEGNPNLSTTSKTPQTNSTASNPFWRPGLQAGEAPVRAERWDGAFHRHQERAALLLRRNPGSSAGGRSRDPAGLHNRAQRSLSARLHNFIFCCWVSFLFY